MKRKLILIFVSVLVLGLVVGFGLSKVELKVSDPLINLNVLIQEASIGHVGGQDGPENTEINNSDDPITQDTGGNTDSDSGSEVGSEEPEPENIVTEFIIRLMDRSIYINDSKCEDIDALEAAVRAGFTEGATYSLVDDYAEYYTYIQTRNRLDEMGLYYKEVEME